MPVAQLLLPHWVGLEANADAVAALPVVLLDKVEGKSADTKARNVGVAAGPEPGPARTALLVWLSSCGARVPVDVIGEPETVELKTMPSPVMPTLVTEPVPLFETNSVRTSVMVDIAELVVTTVAIGMLPLVKPVVLDIGAQLLDGFR
jgi:hypothetical protein